MNCDLSAGGQSSICKRKKKKAVSVSAIKQGAIKRGILVHI